MNDQALKVLVVEDDNALRQLFSAQLQEDPQITTCEASTLVEGAKIARSQPQFVVLIDLSLEDAHDLEALVVMKQIIPGATIVVITDADEQTRIEAIKNGAHGVIAKGTTNLNLANEVRKAVQVHNQELIMQASRCTIDRIFAILKKITEITKPE